MLPALGLSVFPIVAGTLLTYHYQRNAPFMARLAAGACTGLASFATLGFLLTLVFGLQAVTVLVTEMSMAIPLALLVRRTNRAELGRDVSQVTLAGLAAFAALTALLWL